MGVGRDFIARDLVVFELRSTRKVGSHSAANAMLLGRILATNGDENEILGLLTAGRRRTSPMLASISHP
jgi:hypothetical protein